MNILIRTLIVFILTITVSNIYSQNFKETIEWVKSKINKYGKDPLYVKKCNDCQYNDYFTQYYVEVESGQKLNSGEIIKVDSLFFINLKEDLGDGYIMLGDKTQILRMRLCSLKSNGVVEVNITNVATGTTPLGENKIILIFKDGNSRFKDGFILPWNSEPDLFNRMVIAFKRLIEFDSKKEPL